MFFTGILALPKAMFLKVTLAYLKALFLRVTLALPLAMFLGVTLDCHKAMFFAEILALLKAMFLKVTLAYLKVTIFLLFPDDLLLPWSLSLTPLLPESYLAAHPMLHECHFAHPVLLQVSNLELLFYSMSFLSFQASCLLANYYQQNLEHPLTYFWVSLLCSIHLS